MAAEASFLARPGQASHSSCRYSPYRANRARQPVICEAIGQNERRSCDRDDGCAIPHYSARTGAKITKCVIHLTSPWQVDDQIQRCSAGTTVRVRDLAPG